MRQSANHVFVVSRVKLGSLTLQHMTIAETYSPCHPSANKQICFLVFMMVKG